MDFISNPRMLKKRLIVVGLAMFLLSPFLVIFMLVYLFLRHAEQFYNHPTTASSRRWSNLSKWMFREFNEVEHYFRHRINTSVMHASDYLKQFPTPIISIVAKFISFISGGFAAVLIIIAFLDESLLEGHIFGRNLFWYAAVFGTITAISRAAVNDELLVLDAAGAMSLVVQHTHYMPKRWRGKENSEIVRMEFETLFQYTAMMWLEEMASIFLTPYLLIFVVPQRVDDIMQFIVDFTVNIEGVGDVCSFSTFDFQRHGNSNYASPHDALRSQRSSQGKMEKSFLSFQSSYSSWQPNAQGMQFFTTLRTFRGRKLQGCVSRYAHSPPRTGQRSPDLMERNGRNPYFRREAPQNSPGPGNQLGSLWLIGTDPSSHPYLLDWFYSSGPHKGPGNAIDCPTVAVNIDNDEGHEFWKPTSHNEVSHTEDWRNFFANRPHSNLEASTPSPHFQEGSVLRHPDMSNLEASTSSPFFQGESVLRHPDTSTMNPPTRSHWWARGGPGRRDHQEASFLEPPDLKHQDEPPEASFLDPPEFYRHGADDDCSNSHKSMDQFDQQLDFRNYHNSSHTAYPDEFGSSSGGFKLLFDDVYEPSQPPTMNPDSTNIDG